jgi:hypothetical protein
MFALVSMHMQNHRHSRHLGLLSAETSLLHLFVHGAAKRLLARFRAATVSDAIAIRRSASTMTGLAWLGEAADLANADVSIA